MSKSSPPPSDIEQLSGYLVDKVRERSTGRSVDPGETHQGSAPGDYFFSGSLSPGEDDIEESEDDDIYSRISPSAIHLILRIQVTGDDATFSVQPDFDMFYRVLPEWSSREDLPEGPLFKKLDPEIPPVDISTDLFGDTDELESRVNEAMQEAISEAEKQIRDDPLTYRDSDSAERIRRGLQNEEFENEEEYHEEVRSASGQRAIPDLDPRINIDVIDLEGRVQGKGEVYTVKIVLQNASPESENSDRIDNSFFDSKIRASEGEHVQFKPFKFHRLEEDYRYNRDLRGYGINCTVTSGEDEQTLETTCLPIFEQHRLVHETPEQDQAVPGFSDLAEDPVSTLSALKGEMEQYDETVWKAKIEELESKFGEPDQSAVEQRERFQDEIEQLQHGIDILDEYRDVRRAFQLMNEVFEKRPTDYSEWRLFQIVFIVANLPDLASREHDEIDDEKHRSEEVSLLWFPTGGGKTEAYLALIVFQAIFDRIRGKDFGVTSMMRYPLRLLSLQQFQRITEVFIYANKIRRQHGLGGDEFSVGYLTGGTENKMRDLVEMEFDVDVSDEDHWNDPEGNVEYIDRVAERWENDELHKVDKEDHKILKECPECHGDVEVVVNSDDIRVDHRCTTDDCEQDRLPVYVIDNEIYRYLPTMVIGTQDKLAALGYERKFRQLLGHVNEICPDHGYHDGTGCTDKYFCTNWNNMSSIDNDEKKDPVPALQIQDELHLVNEELGTFESHYWSAMEKIIEWNDNNYKLPKIIAATATIEEFENQIQHLYLRQGTLFPSQGPEYRNSFYISQREDEIQRFFMGITPWNRSHINTVVSVLEKQQEILQDMLDEPQAVLNNSYPDYDFDFDVIDSVEELKEVLKFYRTAVSYVMTKNEGARVFQTVETQINEDLQREGYNEIERRQLTGNTSFGEVSEMLDQYEKLEDDVGMLDETEELIISTSSISHGVDLDVLNFMVFFGMPRQTAEYIQSSSRVGRKYPGIVVDCFHPIRERDRSHFHYFGKYHQYLDRLVEPVPVNRWARFSANRTLPGMFMSILLQHLYSDVYDDVSSLYRTSNVKQAHDKRLITQQKLEDLLGEIYDRDWRGSGDAVFKDRITDFVGKALSSIDTVDAPYTSDAIPGKAMWSLRDVDESIDIHTTRKDGYIVDNLYGNNDSSNGGDE